MLPGMRQAVLALIVLVTTVTPVHISTGMFEDYAVIDASQVVVHAGFWVCPEDPEKGFCLVELVQE